jgi:hypothetical protein
MILDVIDAMYEELSTGAIARRAVVIYHCTEDAGPGGDVAVTERYVLDVSALYVDAEEKQEGERSEAASSWPTNKIRVGLVRLKDKS